MKQGFVYLLTLSGFVAGCAATQERVENTSQSSSEVTPVVQQTPVQVTTPAIQQHATDTQAVVPKVAQVESPKAAPVQNLNGVDPLKALGWLKNGNTRFISEKKLRRDGQSAQDRARLTKGQKPHSIVVSCSDSQVPPELVFDQKLGEIFVTRTAGAALDSASIASIEYAVEQLGSRLIVVMGHDSCGAVKAALEVPEGKSAGSPHLDRLVQDIRPRISSFLRRPASPGVVAETSANAQGAAEDLMKRSTIIRDKVLKGEVLVKSAVYHLQTGLVSWTN